MEIVRDVVRGHRIVRGIAVAVAGAIVKAGARDLRRGHLDLLPVQYVAAETRIEHERGRAASHAHHVETPAAADVDEVCCDQFLRARTHLCARDCRRERDETCEAKQREEAYRSRQNEHWSPR